MFQRIVLVISTVLLLSSILNARPVEDTTPLSYQQVQEARVFIYSTYSGWDDIKIYEYIKKLGENNPGDVLIQEEKNQTFYEITGKSARRIVGDANLKQISYTDSNKNIHIAAGPFRCIVLVEQNGSGEKLACHTSTQNN